MKTILTVIILMCLWTVFPCQSAVSDLAIVPNEVEISIIEKSACATHGQAIYQINALQAGDYVLNMWQCPLQKENGVFYPYKIVLNDSQFPLKVIPSKSGWSALSCSNPISLKQGKNTIVISIDAACEPNIEFIEVLKSSSMRKSRMLQSTAYDDFISMIRSQNSASQKGIGTGGAIINPPINNVDTIDDVVSPIDELKASGTPYSYNLRKKDWFTYSFSATYYFNAGETVSCYAQDVENYPIILEVFNKNFPEKYSWTVISDNSSYARLSFTVPERGDYIMKARPFENGRITACNLIVENRGGYMDVPISTMGFPLKGLDTKTVYNFFTAETTGDPILWISSGDAQTPKIIAFNDDYTSSGMYGWGVNARIKKQFDVVSLKPSFVLVSNANSFSPVGECLVYAGCPNADMDVYQFPSLNEDDAMLSAPFDYSYNCLAWVGGISSYSEWPGYDKETGDYVKDDRIDELKYFDDFLGRERYPGCTIYTRENATESNSVIDLWANVENEKASYSHFSIRNNSDVNFHGYDYESKIGQTKRIFHPRYALKGKLYGHVIAHYRVADNQDKRFYSLEESIADGRAYMEKIDISESKREVLDKAIQNISEDVKKSFYEKYHLWEKTFNSSIYSNPDVVAEDESFESLYSFCGNNEEVTPIVYDRILKGEFAAVVLFYKLKNEPRLQTVRSKIVTENQLKKYDTAGRMIIRTHLSTTQKIVEELISEMVSSKRQVRGQNSSQQKDFSIQNDSFSVNNKGLEYEINLTIEHNSNVRLDILDLKGEPLKVFINSADVVAGVYSFSFSDIKEDVILVRCIVNGHVEVKKIRVR